MTLAIGGPFCRLEWLLLDPAGCKMKGPRLENMIEHQFKYGSWGWSPGSERPSCIDYPPYGEATYPWLTGTERHQCRKMHCFVDFSTCWKDIILMTAVKQKLYLRILNAEKYRYELQSVLQWTNLNCCGSLPLCQIMMRHQTETFSLLLALCARNSPVTGEFPSQRPVMQTLDVFFDLRLNKCLSKQSWG